MNRQSIVSTCAAVALGASLLLGTAGTIAAQSCDTCSQSTGVGAGKSPTAVDPGIVPPIIQPIDEDQFFRGVVNHSEGAGGPAVIRMACFGPERPGHTTGHPFAGQAVEALRVPHPLPDLPDVGFTGAAADSITVTIQAGSIEPGLIDPASAQPIVLTTYGVATEIPTSLELPCDGHGIATFTPAPGGEFARSATVPVEFVGQP